VDISGIAGAAGSGLPPAAATQEDRSSAAVGVTPDTGQWLDGFDAMLAALASTTPEWDEVRRAGLNSPARPGRLDGEALEARSEALPITLAADVGAAFRRPAVVDQRALVQGWLPGPEPFVRTTVPATSGDVVASDSDLRSASQDDSPIDPAAIVVPIAVVETLPAERAAELPDVSPHAYSPGPPEGGPHIGPGPPEGGPHIGPGSREGGPHIGPGSREGGPHIGPGSPEGGSHVGPESPEGGSHVGPESPEGGSHVGPASPEDGHRFSSVRQEPNRETPAHQPAKWSELDQGVGLAQETVQPEESESESQPQPQPQAEVSAPSRLPARLDPESPGTQASAAVSETKPFAEASTLPEAAPRTEITSNLEAAQYAQVTVLSGVTSHTEGTHTRIPPAAPHVGRPDMAGADHAGVLPPGLRADDLAPPGRAGFSHPAPIRADTPPPAPARVAEAFLIGPLDRSRAGNDEPLAAGGARVEAISAPAPAEHPGSGAGPRGRRLPDGQSSANHHLQKVTIGAADLPPAAQSQSMPAPGVQSSLPQPVADVIVSPDTAELNDARAANIDRLVQALRISGRGGAWEATVRLEPEHLGPVTIAIRVQGGSVSATVDAEAAPVRLWLEAQRDEIRARLGDHGLELERFDVLDDRGRSADQERRAPRDAYRRAPRRLASTATFEVTV
jgi:hypothetical protein